MYEASNIVSKLVNAVSMRDIMFFSGVAMLCYGIEMIHPSMGFIIGGGILLHKSY